MLFEVLDLLIGIAFGFFHKGREDYWGILKNGAIVGVVISVLIVLISMLLAPGSISFGFGAMGAAGIIIEIVVFVIIFIAGSFIGDQVERVVRK